MIDLLCSRQSSPKLQAPAPGRLTLERILQVAFTVPDHGAIKPAHFVVCQQQGLERLGRLFKDAAVSEKMAERTVDRASDMPLRAPMVIAVGCRYQDHPKVPAIEQAESVACSVYAMQLAFDSEGFASMWRTGDFAYSETVKVGLGFAKDDEIIGFLYVGTAVLEATERRAYAKYSQHVDFWE